MRLLIRLTFAVVAIFLIACAAIIFCGLHDNLHSADLAVVPGNTVHPDGAPSLRLKVRLDQAVDLYHQGYFKRILVSGAPGKEGYDEPKVMAHYLEQRGIPEDAIYQDNEGFTTWDTAKNTASFLREHQLTSTLIISQYFHIPRCRLAFAKFGISPVYSSHARFWSLRDFYSVPREVVGYIAYLLRDARSPAAPNLNATGKS